MGNIGVQEAMQGDISKLAGTVIEKVLEAPANLVRIIVEVRKDSAEIEKNKTIAKVQKLKLDKLHSEQQEGQVSLKDLNRSGDDISRLSDMDKTCYKVLKRNLDETGIKYHVDTYENAEGNRTFSILFEDKNAPKVQQAVEKSLRQMQNPKFMEKVQERPSIMQQLKKAKEKAAEINRNNPEKHKHQEQAR